MGTFLKICGLLIAFAGIYGIYKPTWLANQKTGEVPSRVAIFFGCLFGSIMLFFASGLFTKNTVEVAEVKAQATEVVESKELSERAKKELARRDSDLVSITAIQSAFPEAMNQGGWSTKEYDDVLIWTGRVSKNEVILHSKKGSMSAFDAKLRLIDDSRKMFKAAEYKELTSRFLSQFDKNAMKFVAEYDKYISSVGQSAALEDKTYELNGIVYVFSQETPNDNFRHIFVRKK